MAKQAYKAMDARHVLSTVGIDWQRSSDNLIYIKTGLHRRLHTNIYYAYVNQLVVIAHNYNKVGLSEAKLKTIRKQRVETVLYGLRKIIKAMDYASLY